MDADLNGSDAYQYRFQDGVGAQSEARLVPLQPLIEYYTREMGELPGRLMIATNFLGDIRMLPDWHAQSPELRAAVEQAQALVISTMIRLVNLQNDADVMNEHTHRNRSVLDFHDFS